MDKEKLDLILTQHKDWLDSSEARGTRANLSRADLSKTNLSKANLSGANLSEANLSRANLSGADLSRADLSGTNLSWANLSGANLSFTCIKGFYIGKHFGYYHEGLLKIGCTEHPLDYWVEKYEVIGRNANYSDNDIYLYGAHIKMLALLKQKGKI